MTRNEAEAMTVLTDAPKRTRRGNLGIALAIISVPALFAVLAAVAIVPQMVVVPVNDAAARDVETRLLALPLPEGAEHIDSVSMAGKLVGNGNGMQYLGALLIRSDQTVSELQAFYDAVDELSVTVTTSGGLERFHGAPGFLGAPAEPGTSIVYASGDGPGGAFEDIDLRGH